ncbi:MAG: tRNA (adenosine(37)-N6)-dimethylallyltransferase MiaA [Treponema sp.]|nr:tRNA (adenosine(37)-N6)-dimethylallyltransferase MiaA [Treponema sp.]
MNSKGQIPVIVIFAPTACGKTALVQKIFGQGSLSCFKGTGEIISADSQAVYRYMDIGTAKPSPEETASLPHHLVDVVEPDKQFGAGEFLEEADRICREIHSRGKMPVIVGGTGFYIRAFLLGLPPTPISNSEMREKIKKRLSSEGNAALYHELKTIDPEYAGKIDLHDGYRICRALEVYYSSGKTLSSYMIPVEERSEYSFCTIILQRDRKELYERIDQRVVSMFKKGLRNEVEKLRQMGYGKYSPGMKAIGYSEFFDGESQEDEALIKRIQHHSHRYAKKQYTYMNGISGTVIHADDIDGIEKTISSFCSQVHFPAGW